MGFPPDEAPPPGVPLGRESPEELLVLLASPPFPGSPSFDLRTSFSFFRKLPLKKDSSPSWPLVSSPFLGWSSSGGPRWSREGGLLLSLFPLLSVPSRRLWVLEMGWTPSVPELLRARGSWCWAWVLAWSWGLFFLVVLLRVRVLVLLLALRPGVSSLGWAPLLLRLRLPVLSDPGLLWPSGICGESGSSSDRPMQLSPLILAELTWPLWPL